ncbi:MAG: hypothetical protein ACJ796_17150 [Gemmatimonadaceae bacterium]
MRKKNPKRRSAASDSFEAQHGDQPGQHVTTSAYALLRSNAIYVLSRL